MLYGETKKGTVSVTQGQVKKHFTQFKAVEKAFLFKTLKLVKRVKLSNHLKHKDIAIDKNIITQVLKTGAYSIIEYNERTYTNGTSKRALIRVKESQDVLLKDKGLTPCNLCFVIDIHTGVIVTAYYNEVDDNHSTINYNRYDEDLKIVK